MSCLQHTIDVVNILSNYIDVSENLKSEIEDLFVFKMYKKNEFFFRPESPHENIALILSGGMRHFVLDEEGNERSLDFCMAGEFTGAISLLNSEQSFENIWIVACEDSWLGIIQQSQIEYLLKNYSEIKDFLNKIMLEYFQIKSRREMDFLCNDSLMRYKNFLKYYPELSNKIPQYQIASFLGMTPETLSRIKIQLKKTQS